jgi:hypothetical protein
MSKEFTGDIEAFRTCRNFLQKKGYNVADATHTGNNVFEFKESIDERQKSMGIRKVRAHIEDGKVITKEEVIGFVMFD